MGKNCSVEVVSRLDKYINSFWEVQLPRMSTPIKTIDAVLTRYFILDCLGFRSILIAKVGIMDEIKVLVKIDVLFETVLFINLIPQDKLNIRGYYPAILTSQLFHSSAWSVPILEWL
jgi:hypothetical protein